MRLGPFSVHIARGDPCRRSILDMASNSQEKGDLLEAAVRAIEAAIVRASPALAEGTFVIEGKKVVSVEGVRHEIDLHVHATLAPGYDATFIFECKNWKQRVGKNEIIIFTEKIRALAAQRGFFVARTFSRDARAQARADPRMELLTASQLDPDIVMVPGAFHGIAVCHTDAHVTFDGGGKSNQQSVDIAALRLVVDGILCDPKTYVDQLVTESRDARVNRFQSVTAEEGEHELSFSSERAFGDGEATINERPLKRIAIEGTVRVRVTKARVVSAFEVLTRGRHISVQLMMGDGLHVTAEFVELSHTRVGSA